MSHPAARCSSRVVIGQRPLATVVLIGCLVIGHVTRSEAQVTTLTVNKGLAAKIASVGKSVAARAGCFSKDASKGVVDLDGKEFVYE